MPIRTRQSQLTPQKWTFHGVTLGTVVDTNDPQQMGRVRAFCPLLNDSQDALITDIPWAAYATPFGGTVQAGTRGDENDQVTGPVAYGMWGIPKIGSQVLIMCLDGNPQTRVWIGCLHTNMATHTMPHGRFSYKTDNNLPDEEAPVGPISTFENPIEPLHRNLRQAFGEAPEGENNYEFQSRGADFQVSGVTLGQQNHTLSLVEDDQDIPTDGSLPESRQGYQTSRIAPDLYTEVTPRNLDNMVTTLVSPGFHALSMDDRAENCRVRIRTVGGHQIILDDTNERMYISTATGENWIEIDERGNIDIFTTGKISAHAEHDINFTTDRSFRVYAKAGIHLKSDTEVRITSEEDMSLKTSGSFRARSLDNMYFESQSKDIHLKAAVDLFQTSQREMHFLSNELVIESKSSGSIRSRDDFTIQSSGNTNIVGATVNLNSGGEAESAAEATEADSRDRHDAFLTNRIPQHEPWPRVDTKDDTSTDPLFSYSSTEIGRRRRVTTSDGDGSEIIDIERGPYWRR